MQMPFFGRKVFLVIAFKASNMFVVSATCETFLEAERKSCRQIVDTLCLENRIDFFSLLCFRNKLLVKIVAEQSRYQMRV
jgi:hypothetical protein